MGNNIHKKLLQKEMDRKEFLQFSGGIIIVLLGLSNLVSFIRKYAESDSPRSVATSNSQHGFGSRKFGA